MRWRTSATSTGSGSTSTVRTAAPRSLLRACALSSTESSEPTRSSSIRTSGSSHLYDCCALLYREPELARAAHTQTAGYLEPLQGRREWNPSDYAVNLTRRARGLPFWFSLAAHGTDAYSEAIEQTLTSPATPPRRSRARAYVELLREPDLSVVVFRRIGWTPRSTTTGRSGCDTRTSRSSRLRPTPARRSRGSQSSTRGRPKNDISTILDTLA